MHIVKDSASKYGHLCQSHANFNSVPSVLTFESESLELCSPWQPSWWLRICTIFVKSMGAKCLCFWCWSPDSFSKITGSSHLNGAVCPLSPTYMIKDIEEQPVRSIAYAKGTNHMPPNKYVKQMLLSGLDLDSLQKERAFTAQKKTEKADVLVQHHEQRTGEERKARYRNVTSLVGS